MPSGNMAHAGRNKVESVLEEEKKYVLEPRKPKRPLNSFALSCAILASLNSWLIGYDIGVMNGVAPFIKQDTKISKENLEFFIGTTLCLASIVGAAAAGQIADMIGRRRTIGATAALLLTGAAVLVSASSLHLLILGRIVEGLGVGFALVTTPLYTSEMSPAYCRGSLVSLNEVFSNVGVLLGCMSSFLLTGLRHDLGWRVAVALGILPAVMLAAGALVMPESPRWLVMQNRTEEAEQVLLRTSRSRAEASLCLTEITNSAGFPQGAGHSSKAGGKWQGVEIWFRVLCPTLAVRRMLLTAFVVQFFQQATGIETTVYYSHSLFNEAGIISRWGVVAATLGVGLCKTAFVLVSALWQDRAGRRPLLLFSGLGMSISLGVLALGFSLLRSNASEVSLPLELKGANMPGFPAILSLLAMCSYVSFFSVGFGPVTGVLTSEIFPLTLRARAMGLATAVNRVASGLLALVFLRISDLLSASRAVLLLSLLSALATLFVHQWVPETKGKTLEAMETIFQQKHVEKLSIRHSSIDLPAVPGTPDPLSNESLSSGSSSLQAEADQEPLFYKRKAVPGTAKGASFKELFSRVNLLGSKELKGKASVL